MLSRLLGACVAFVVLVAPAGGAVVDDSGSFFNAGFSYVGEGTEANSVSITFTFAGGGAYIATEQSPSTAQITATPPCQQLDAPERGQCASSQSNAIEVLLGSGNDKLSAESVNGPISAAGASGDDEINLGNAADLATGMSGNDTLRGGDGADTLGDGGLGIGDPGAGADILEGQGGNDLLLGGENPFAASSSGAGADDLRGGAGVDTADYSQRTAPLNVTVDAGPGAGDDDGETGEHDDVEAVEILLLGSAADVAVGAASADRLVGGAGGDTLTGGAGADMLYGGKPEDPFSSGDDMLDGGLGADVLFGGDGLDTATYLPRTAGVIVTLDGVNNDGEAGEGDRVMGDVERVVGGAGADALTGSGGADTLEGSAGADALDGGGGDDNLLGGADADTVTGGSGEDTIDAGEGDDVVKVRDNGARDSVTCGAGTDSVEADASDVVAADCEAVDRPAVPGPSVTPVPTAGPGGGSGVSGNAVVVVAPVAGKAALKGSSLRLAVSCPARATVPCAGLLTLLSAAKKPIVLSSLGFSVAPGRSKTLRLPIARKRRAALKKARRATARFETAAGRNTAAITLARR